MHRKFRQGSTETLKDFPLGKPLLLHKIFFCHISPGIDHLNRGGANKDKRSNGSIHAFTDPFICVSHTISKSKKLVTKHHKKRVIFHIGFARQDYIHFAIVQSLEQLWEGEGQFSRERDFESLTLKLKKYLLSIYNSVSDEMVEKAISFF